MLNNIPTAISMVAGDKGFSLHFTCEDSTGTAINLTGATLTFNTQLESDTSVQSTGSMVIDNATAGTCHYVVTATDFPIAGTYNAQIVASFSSGTEEFTFDGITITATDRLPV